MAKTHFRVRGGELRGLQYYACGYFDKRKYVEEGATHMTLPSTDKPSEVTCGNCVRTWQFLYGEPPMEEEYGN